MDELQRALNDVATLRAELQQVKAQSTMTQGELARNFESRFESALDELKKRLEKEHENEIHRLESSHVEKIEQQATIFQSKSAADMV